VVGEVVETQNGKINQLHEVRAQNAPLKAQRDFPTFPLRDICTGAPHCTVDGSDPYLYSARKQQIALAAQQSIPAMFSGRAAAVDGGMMSYGIDFADGYRQAGIYVSRVLKGEKPGDLPVIRSTKFELAINLATAKQLGLTIPLGPLSIADEVIE
jgi:putative ABC transport system substrate-binding protein